MGVASLTVSANNNCNASSAVSRRPAAFSKWNKIRDGAEGDEVEQRLQIEVLGAGQAGFAAAFDDGVGEFEGEAG